MCVAFINRSLLPLISLAAANVVSRFACAMVAHDNAASRLRQLCKGSMPALSSQETAVALPGVHDALSAKIFARAGASALFLSGFGVSACRLGVPDAGILTLSEMEDATRNAVTAVAYCNGPSLLKGGNGGPAVVPIVVDGDTGYGGVANIRRTVRGLAAAGAAAVTIEDQEFPKRCTYAAGSSVRVVSREASLSRVRFAIAARDEVRELDGGDVLVVARTDCRAGAGLKEVISRCRSFEREGADIVYAENLQSRSEYIALRESLDPATPTILAQVQQEPGDSGEESQRTLYTLEEVGNMGYNFALFGVTALQTVVDTLQRTARDFLTEDGAGGVLRGEAADTLSPFSVVKDVVGFPELDTFQSRFNVE